MRLFIAAAVLGLSVIVAAAAEVDDFMSPGGCAGQDTFCPQSAQQFRSEYPQALRGTYQAQRNVAYCLTTGCDGAVKVDRITGCAWRAVIIASGARQVDQGDTQHLRSCREKLDGIDMGAATAKAEQIFRRVYKRAMR